MGASPLSRSRPPETGRFGGSRSCRGIGDRIFRPSTYQAVMSPRFINITVRKLAGICLVFPVFVGVAFAEPTPSWASTPRSTPSSRTLQASLEAVAVNYRISCQSPGAAVGVRTSDGSNHVAVVGQFAPGVVLDRNSQFLAGSVTKLFVATIALQLIAEHRLSLDDVVDRYLRRWPRGSRITIAMLLGHRSGMGDFGNDFSTQQSNLVLSNLSRDFTYSQVLDLVRAVPAVAQPGAIYHYSNANYVVLGAILQRITGQTLGTLIDSRILQPLRLHRTLYGPDNLKKANTITFHGLYDVFRTGTPIDIGGFPRNAALTVDPAGAGMFSSLPDLLTFSSRLFGSDKLLAAQQRSEIDENRKHHKHQRSSSRSSLCHCGTRRCVSWRADHRGVRQRSSNRGCRLVQSTRPRSQ